MKTLLTLSTALLLALSALPLREWAALDSLRAPVNRWLWLRSEIVNQPRRTIDYAFTGSSMTLSAIDPERIVARAPGTSAYNFSHFAWGHYADYFVVRPLLERHDVGTVVIEIPRHPPNEPHSETVHLVGASELGGEMRAAIRSVSAMDLLTYSASLKQQIARIASYTATTLFSFPRHVLDRGVAWTTGRPWEFEQSGGGWEDHRGFVRAVERRMPDPAFREQQAREAYQVPTRIPYPMRQTHPLPGSRNDFYLHRLKELADERGTRLVFLYIPPWKKRPPPDAQHRYYSQFGEVVVPDLLKLHVPEYYVDALHLYGPGTQVFTDEVLQLLTKGTAGTPFNDLYRAGDSQ